MTGFLTPARSATTNGQEAQEGMSVCQLRGKPGTGRLILLLPKGAQTGMMTWWANGGENRRSLLRGSTDPSSLPEPSPRMIKGASF